MIQLNKWLPDRPPISVTVSLDRQKDINRNSSVTQLIYLKITNIILITKEQVLNNMSYYILVNLSRH